MAKPTPIAHPDGRERILLVEDEAIMAEVVARYLGQAGYAVDVATTGPEALAIFHARQPRLVLLDVMLPGGIDGFEICQQIRATARTPVIMLTARVEEVDKLLGLGLGADDYVTKPFSPRELVARVKAVLRRSASVGHPSSADDDLVFGGLRINPATRTIANARGPAELTAREFDLLLYLARHPGQVFTRAQLLDAVWDYHFPGDESTVTVHMRRLREKVEADPARPRLLKTVWGVGYKFDA
jgi:DNA-binding response OmpR family regulator